MSLRLILMTLLLPSLAPAADFRDLKSGVAFKLTQDTVVYDLDSAVHPFRNKKLPKWTALDEESPIEIFGWGLKRRKLPAGTVGVMMKDSFVRLISRGRNYADCMAVFQVGERHFMIKNSDSTLADDLNALTNLVRQFASFAVLPPPGPVAAAVEAP